MRREKEVVNPDRRLGRVGMSVGVLGLDRGREQEGGGRDGVCDEAEHVAGWEVYREAQRRLPLPIQDGLRVKGCGPIARASALCATDGSGQAYQQRKYSQPRSLEMAFAKSTTSESAMLRSSYPGLRVRVWGVPAHQKGAGESYGFEATALRS